MRRLQVLTDSELGSFRSCQFRWWLKYPQLLRTVVQAPVAAWGSCLHAAVHTGYLRAYDLTHEGAKASRQGRLPDAIEGCQLGAELYYRRYLDTIDEAEQAGHIDEETAHERHQDAEAMLNTALWVVPNFFRATEDDLHTLVPLGFERPFRVPVARVDGHAGHLQYEGVIDAIWWDPQHHAVVVDDHKSTDKLIGNVERRMMVHPQMSGYLHAVGHQLRRGLLTPLDGTQLPDNAHERIGRCRYNAIRRKAPAEPHVNKIKPKKTDEWGQKLLAIQESQGVPMGLVSAAVIDTTAEIYLAALDVQQTRRKLPPTPAQLERYGQLQAQGERYFARFEFFRTPDEIERWRQEVWVEARRMRRVERGEELPTRNAGACSPANMPRCGFQAPCMDDTTETRAMYRIAETRHEEVANASEHGFPIEEVR